MSFQTDFQAASPLPPSQGGSAMRRIDARIIAAALIGLAVLALGAVVVLRDDQPARNQQAVVTSSQTPVVSDSLSVPVVPPSLSQTPTPTTSSATTTTSTPPTTPKAQPTTQAAPAGSFALGRRPFSASSSWNTAVASSARYTKLAWPAPGAPTGIYWVNWEEWTPAVLYSKPSDPLVTVQTPSSWGWPAQTLKIHLPTGVSGAKGTDGELIVIDGDMVHNFFQFKRTSDTTATAQAYGGSNAVTGIGWADPVTKRGGGVVGAGSSQLAGLLVEAEVKAGEINHALQMGVAQPLQAPGFAGDATSGDGHSPTGIVQVGQRLAIPPSTPMPSGLTPLGQKVFRALQKYGAFDIDTASTTTTMFRAQNNGFDKASINGLREDVKTLIPLLQRVN